jgi:hypothetical protein
MHTSAAAAAAASQLVLKDVLLIIDSGVAVLQLPDLVSLLLLCSFVSC